MPDPLIPPPVSPTGTPVIPASWMKFILPVVTIAGGTALASASGVDVSFLPPIVPKVCALVAFLGGLMGIASPGWRK